MLRSASTPSFFSSFSSLSSFSSFVNSESLSREGSRLSLSQLRTQDMDLACSSFSRGSSFGSYISLASEVNACELDSKCSKRPIIRRTVSDIDLRSHVARRSRSLPASRATAELLECVSSVHCENDAAHTLNQRNLFDRQSTSPQRHAESNWSYESSKMQDGDALFCSKDGMHSISFQFSPYRLHPEICGNELQDELGGALGRQVLSQGGGTFVECEAASSLGWPESSALYLRGNSGRDEVSSAAASASDASPSPGGGCDGGRRGGLFGRRSSGSSGWGPGEPDNGGTGDTDLYYRQALKKEPGHPLLLRNYARFLYEVEYNINRAEEYYARALLANPADGEVLAQYAKFIWEVHGDEERASSYFEQARMAEPGNSFVLAAYTSFLWSVDNAGVLKRQTLSPACSISSSESSYIVRPAGGR